MNKTKLSIIGLGGIAQIAHLPTLKKMDTVEIVAVCDVDKAKTKNVAQKYGVKNYYTDLDKMLDEVKADCLIVTSPTSFHKEHAINGLSRGLHVLVEKPLARFLKEGEEIVNTAKKSKKQLMVGMNNRFRPDFMMQQSFISAGELGEIFYIKTGFLKKRSTSEKWSIEKEEAGGGVFMDLGIVLLDISMWLMKYPAIKSISAVNYFHSFKTVEDSSLVFLKFENGSTVSIETSWTLLRENDIFYCNVYGKEGSTSINPLRIYKKMLGTLVNVTPIKFEKPSNIFIRSCEYELQHFINSIQNNSPVISSGDEALARLKIIDAIYKSAKTGKEVLFK
jgi:predicted dehydrogenase